jgi:hypothetical protein
MRVTRSRQRCGSGSALRGTRGPALGCPLAKKLPEEPLQRIMLERDAPTQDGDRRHLLHLHHRRDLTLPTAPMILLDADLDPVIAGKFWPEVRMVEIPARQQAEIVQVVDRSCSMRFLLGGAEGDQQRADRRLAELQRLRGGCSPTASCS